MRSHFFKKKKLASQDFKTSYSQYGEDQIILGLIFLLKLGKVNFIDIGANDPYLLNNTALFYERGIHGINIEPDPEVYKKLVKHRLHDINLNIGISKRDGRLKYYRFTDSVYNTLSEEEFIKLKQRRELKQIDSIEIEVSTYNNIVVRYLKGKSPTVLFVDTEGMDEEIAGSIDYNKYAPVIMCIETFSYGNFEKDYKLIEKIKNFGYDVHADTFVNTIFINRNYLPFVKP